jgi:UDP-glucose 4-epimerase
MSLRVLVAGGAGYIGSHMVKALVEAGHIVVTLDDFSTGGRPELPGEAIVRGSIGDARVVGAVLDKGRFDAVMHFAARSIVAESARDPALYWQKNVNAGLTLFNAMVKYGPLRLVFSSTAAVYGDPGGAPVKESHPCAPVNPYGHTKLALEHALTDYQAAYGLESVRLRYFNAAGAHPDADLTENHEPETHLIPIVLQSAAGLRGPLGIFGDDYPTPDGTCIRDYVHVCDLAQAHLLAVDRLVRGKGSGTFNLGNSGGYSVREVIDAARRVTGKPVRVETKARRPGDPAILVSDSTLVRRELGWRPRYEALEEIIATAWHAMPLPIIPTQSRHYSAVLR